MFFLLLFLESLTYLYDLSIIPKQKHIFQYIKSSFIINKKSRKKNEEENNTHMHPCENP